MERPDDDRKFSFSYDVGGEKLRLIDVSKEDDFLIDSSLFDSLEDLRLSVAFDGTNDYEAIRMFGLREGDNAEERILQKENNLSSSGSMEPARPSYLRKSLAWDSAFFNSAGVLDPDELAFINRGLKTVEDIRTGKAKTRFPVYGSRKDVGHQNKIKIKSASQRHSIQRSERTKIKHDSRREEASCKHPKPSERMEDILRGQSVIASLNEYDTETENKAATRLGKDTMVCKKSAFLNSCSLPSGYLSSPTFSSTFSISTNASTVTLYPYNKSLSGPSRKVPSALVKGKAESQKGKLCASTSLYGTPERLIKNNKELGYYRLSTLSRSTPNNLTGMPPGCSSDDVSLSKSTSRGKQVPDELEAHLDTSVVRSAGLQSDALLGPNTPNNLQRKSSLSLQCEEIKSPAEMNLGSFVGTCPISTEPRKKCKQSGLRQPSPKIGFFDEEKAMFSKANGGLQFQYELESTLPNEDGPINQKRPAKLLLDNTSIKTKTSKHSLESHLLQSASGIKGRSTSSDKKLWNSSPRISRTMKSWSDLALRRCRRKFSGTEEGICHKARKVNARECDRKRFCQNPVLKGDDDHRQVKGRLKKRLALQNKGQRDVKRIQGGVGNQSMEEENMSQKTILGDLHSLHKDKTRIPSNWEDQVNGLSRLFDIIDLRKDMLMEFKGNKDSADSQGGDSSIEENVNNNSPFFGKKSILADQHQGQPNISPNPNQSSLFLSGSLPSSRTPLADRTLIRNQNGSLKSSGESTEGRMVAKAPVSSFEGIDKENISKPQKNMNKVQVEVKDHRGSIKLSGKLVVEEHLSRTEYTSS